MVEITYDHGRQAVQVTVRAEPAIWPVIRRVFEERSQETEVFSSNALRLPVWEFLACRKSLAYIFQKHGLKYECDDFVSRILAEALERERSYQQQTTAQAVDPESVENALHAKGFKRLLTPEQRRNIAKLVSLTAGADFSVPGAGKTTEALAYYWYRRESGTRLLVVAPKNAFAAWEEQLQLCLEVPPSIKRLVGGERSIARILETTPEIMLITYQQLLNVRHLLAEQLLTDEFYMFLDESHRIKRGAEGQWASSVLSLSHLPAAKLILSGTPLPNSVADLIPQLSFIYPEVDFDAGNAAEVIRPIFVRTTKEELGLPPVQRIYRPILLKPKQRNLYELLRSEEYRQLSRLSSRERMFLRSVGKSIVKLLQVVSNPALLAKDQASFPEEFYDVLLEGDSPKVEYACQQARRLVAKGKKVLIWSTFVENVETISDRLSDLGADFIHGGVEAGSEDEEDTREWKIRNFHENPNCSVLVANPAACAEGISLHTVCHHAIYIDRNYNAAQYLQSEDRIHRLGLPEDVTTTVEILYSPDTIDESVRRRLERKVALMAQVLNDNSLNIEPIDPDLEVDGITSDDVADLMAHLKREV